MAPIIGIDLGTSTSEIAYYNYGKSNIITNQQKKNKITPSIVGIDSKTRELSIGEDATGFYGDSVVEEIKRRMGTSEKVKLGDTEYSPEEISSMILKYLKSYAEQIIREPITEAVITVPANFSIEARKATEIAAELAGIKPLRLIQEPTSAALAYGVSNSENDEKVLVYDLGGGTFDVSIVEIFQGNVDVLAHDGDRYLGGKDFDERIVQHAVAYLKTEHDLDIEDDELQKHRLKRVSKEVKEKLSNSATASLKLPAVGVKKQKPFELDLEISRDKFEELIDDLVKKTTNLTESAIKKAKLKKDDIHKVLLVGGSTRVPYIRESVKNYFGFEPSNHVEPDFAVAEGAAIQASIINGDSNAIIMDRVAYGFGMNSVANIDGKFVNGVYSQIVMPNSPMLKPYTSGFKTTNDNQIEVEIQCYQREPSNNSIWVNDCVAIGEPQVLDNIPKDEAGKQFIDVTMTYNLDGIIDVLAEIKSTGDKKEFQIKTATGTLNEQDGEDRIAKLNALWQQSQYADKAKLLIDSVTKRMDEMKKEDVDKAKGLLEKLKVELVKEDLEKIEALMDEITDILINY